MKNLVRRLAVALDSDDYETAFSTLAKDVQYELGAETLVGPQAVVDSYQAASVMAHDLFDQVGYDHEIVESSPDGEFTINYEDILTIGDETLVHHARQKLKVDPAIGVTHIFNIELPGERERVDEFLHRHGKSR